MQMLRRSLGTGHRTPMLQGPVGFGKTVVASSIIQGALAKGNRVCFVAPAVTLIDQTVQRLWEDGIEDVGVIQADHPMTDYSKPVQVASAQTIEKRDFNRLDFQVVIVDEAHIMRKRILQWINDWSAVPFLGLSATPWSRGLGKFYDDLLIPATTQQLIDEGSLSPFRVYAPSSPDLSGVRVLAGDYNQGQLSQAMQRNTLVADVVDTWIARGEGRPTIAFCVDCAHAQSVQAEFLAKGVNAAYIDAFTPREERLAIFKRFTAGEHPVMCNVGTLVAGVDLDVRCIILARPTKSEMRFVQMIGRGLRTAPGKDDCLILDHSDTHFRLGFVTDIHHETLCDGAPKESSSTSKDDEEPKAKTCSKCGALRPPRVHICSACGFAAQKQSKVENVAGELSELEAGTKTQRKHNLTATQAEKLAFYGGLKFHAEQKGYKPGWADHAYKSRYGVFPNAYKDAPLCEPNPDVLGFIRHQNIRRAKSRQRAALCRAE